MRDFCITKAAEATLSDTADLTEPGIGILLNVSGKVKLVTKDGSTITPYLVAGVWHPMQVKQIFSTGTDAAVAADSVYVGW